MAAIDKTLNSARGKSRLSLKNKKTIILDISPAPVPRSSLRIRTSSTSDSHDKKGVNKKNQVTGSSAFAQNGEVHHDLPNGLSMGRISTICPLANLGNTCFLNSVLYALRFLPGFIHDVHHLHKHLNNSSNNSEPLDSLTPRINLLNELHSIFSQLKEEENSYIDTRRIPALHPLHFLESLRSVNPLFEGNRQQDAHELLHCLLDQLSNLPQEYCKAATEKISRLAKPKKRKRCQNLDSQSYDVVGSKFVGRMRLETKCCECEQTNSKEENFLEVCVPVKTKADFDDDEEVTDTEILLAALCEEAPLNGSNKYWCESCCHHNEARRTVHYPQLPPNLLIHVKRFNSYSRAFAYKCCDQMPAPLQLPCFCYSCLLVGQRSPPANSNSSASDLCDSLKRRKTPAGEALITVAHLPYYLTAFVCHLGATISSGHYISFVRVDSSRPLHCSKEECSIDGSSRSVSGRQDCSFSTCCSSQLEKILSSMANGHSVHRDDNSAPHREGIWLECDDEKIKVVSPADVVDVLGSSGLTPYLLFYSR